MRRVELWLDLGMGECILKSSRVSAVVQRESFDRIIRDAEHLYRVIQYIGRNPLKAGLSAAETALWIRPAWVECGWDFEGGASVKR